jgi:hypothetical protein
VGSTSVLVEGARLGVDEAENPKIKKKVYVLSEPFKASNTFVCRHFWTLDEDKTCNPGTPRKAYETEFGCASLKVAYVHQTSILPSIGRLKRGMRPSEP